MRITVHIKLLIIVEVLSTMLRSLWTPNLWWIH